jgi:hypothetical protein
MLVNGEREKSATAWQVRHRSGCGKWRFGAELGMETDLQGCGVCGLQYVRL